MRKRSAFTLVELLCVLVISAILLTLLSHALAGGLLWSRTGFEEEVIGDQLDQALDYIEYDVRGAIDVDVEYFAHSDSRPLEEIRSSSTLRLLSVDEGDERAMGRISYRLRFSDNTYNRENPPERPRPNHILYRGQEDSIHRGADQPLAMYLSSNSGLLGEPRGLLVYYYGAGGERCSLAEEIYSVEVRLCGLTKSGEAITRSRQIPLTAKFE